MQKCVSMDSWKQSQTVLWVKIFSFISIETKMDTFRTVLVWL